MQKYIDRINNIDWDKDEFNEEARRAGFYSLGNYWTVHTVANLKGASYTSNTDEVNYVLKAVDILQSERAKQIFEKGNKNN